jgi:hypothetical protein
MWNHRQLLIVDTQKLTPTTVQATQIEKWQTLLLKRIQKFTEALYMFMPGLNTYLAAQVASGVTESASQLEQIKIHLPSSIPATNHPRVCIPGLPEIKDCLQFAQAHESLSSLRCHLRTRIMARKLSDKNASSQQAYV